MSPSFECFAFNNDRGGKKATTTSLNFDIEAVKLEHARKAWNPTASVRGGQVQIVSLHIWFELCDTTLEWKPIGGKNAGWRINSCIGFVGSFPTGRWAVVATTYRSASSCNACKPKSILPKALQGSAKRRGCLLSYSQAEPGRDLTQPRKHLLAEPCT